MASAAQTFRQAWRIGRRVQEKAAPHRAGTVRAVQGTGQNARITVGFTGRPAVTLHPSQLTLL